MPGGESDESLARDMAFHHETAQSAADIVWPAPDPARWRELLQRAFEGEVAGEVARVRVRQENSLRRELERIDDYFENYERELTARANRSWSRFALPGISNIFGRNLEWAFHRRSDIDGG